MGVDRDPSVARVSLTVAVRVRKSDLFNIEGGKCAARSHSGIRGVVNSSPRVVRPGSRGTIGPVGPEREKLN